LLFASLAWQKLCSSSPLRFEIRHRLLACLLGWRRKRKQRSAVSTQNYLFSEVGQYIGTMPAMQSSIPISDSKFGK
jgi:hypothetical protein